MKLDKRQLGLHLPWVMLATLVTTLLAVWYVRDSWEAGEWLGGGSPAGLACGVFVGLVIAYEMLLWPRKYFRKLRLIPARYWMAGHIWLGLASAPLAILHSGFHLGGWLSSLFLILFLLTILSGLYGLALQNLLPKLALRVTPAETIYSQIDHVARQNIADLRQTIAATCGTRGSSEVEPLTNFDPDSSIPSQRVVVVGAVREIGLVKGRTISTRTVSVDPQDYQVLWEAFDVLEPYLEQGSRSGSNLREKAAASRWFSELSKSCSPSGQCVVHAMEECYAQRQQFDLQRKIHHWLHAWIPIHVGLSVAVTILLIAHVITAMQYR